MDKSMCNPDWYKFFLVDPTPGDVIRRMLGRGGLPAEVVALAGVAQDPVWHPEGDAFEHTCHVVNAMAQVLSREGIGGDRRVTLLLAALTHDLGKAVSTKWHPEKQKWVAYGHDVTGVPLARTALTFLQTCPEKISAILPLVRWHMAHTRKDFTAKAVAKLSRELFPANIADLVLLMEADCAGRPPAPPGLPPAVLEQLIPTALKNRWYTDIPNDSRYLHRRPRPGPV